MNNSRKCMACKVLFLPDARNSRRQHFCPKDSCQCERRRQEQRLRRSQLVRDDFQGEGLPARRRLQKASAIPEALFQSQSPLIIGLISMLTDSTNREDIEHTLLRLWERGQSILKGGCTTSVTKDSKDKPKLTVNTTAQLNRRFLHRDFHVRF